MSDDRSRRDFLGLLGVGGVTFASALWGCGGESASSGTLARSPAGAGAGTGTSTGTGSDYFFLQLSDTHWGFRGPPNPEAAETLPATVARIVRSTAKPALIVFTGDLTHTTDDRNERRERMKRFREIISPLEAQKGTRVLFLPGEHDAAPDRGDTYRELFGETPYSFDHGGIHFIALDNASAPGGALGDAQLSWLAADLARTKMATPVVVFAHRPLFPLFPDWEWATTDGARAIELLNARPNVTVFYGHIHQEHHMTTGNVVHHASRSLVFPLPAAGSTPKRAPLPWDPSAKDHGLGFRKVNARAGAPPTFEEEHLDGPLTYAADARPVMERSCFSCHTGDGPAAADHDFGKLEVASAQRDRIHRAVASGAMPPSSRAPLDPASRETLLRWVEWGGK